MPKNSLPILMFVLVVLLASACSPSDAVYVQDDPALRVHINNTNPLAVVVTNPVGAVSVSGNVTVGNTVPVTVSGNVTINNVGTEDGRLSVMSKPYDTGVAEGDIAGHTSFRKLGYNPTVGTALEDIWLQSNVYVFPTVAQQMELVSTSAEDDPDKGAGVPGTGIHTVTIVYLDGSYVQRTEDINLNGTGVVTTTAVNILRVNDIRAKTVGSTYAAVGTITIRNLADTPVYRDIQATYTKGRTSAYTVPHGQTLYLNELYAGVGGVECHKYG